MEVRTTVGNGPTRAAVQDAALLGRPPLGARGQTVASAPALAASLLTVEAVLWPTRGGPGPEASDPRFVCVVLADGVELGRAVSFPLGPLPLPSGRPDSRLTLRFVTSRPTEAYEGEVLVPFSKLVRPGAPRSSSLWLGLPPCQGGAASFDLQQAMLNTQNPEVPKICLSVSRPLTSSSNDLAPIPEGPLMKVGDTSASLAGSAPDASPGPACGSGHWARSGAPLLWRYEPGDGFAIKVRRAPDVDAQWTGSTVHPGEVFQVSQEHLGPGGVRYLQLADGRGWLFDIKPGVGTMCVRQAALATPVGSPSRQQPPPLQEEALSSPARRAALSSSPLRRHNGGTPCAPIAEGQLLGSESPAVPSPAVPRMRPKALCDTEWVRSGRSVSPSGGRQRQESPPRGGSERGQALCRTAEFLRSQSALVPSGAARNLRKGQSLTLPATSHHNRVPVVNDVGGTREELRRLDAGRSQSVLVSSTHKHDMVPVVRDFGWLAAREDFTPPPQREGGRSQSVSVPSAHRHEVSLVAPDLGVQRAQEEMNLMRSELTASRAAEMKNLFLRQDLQDQLLQLRKELDMSHQAALELQWSRGRQDEASAELRGREECQRRELRAAQEEVKELSALREKQVYMEDDIMGMSVQLDTLRKKERQLEDQLQASKSEVEQLRAAKEAQEYLQDDVLKVGAEVDALRRREQQLLSELQDAGSGCAEVLLLRQQLDEANAMAEQGAFLQDEIIGVSTQLERSRLLEAQMQDQLTRALAEVADLHSKQAGQPFTQEKAEKADNPSQKEKAQEIELTRVREELLESQRATEELRRDLEERVRQGGQERRHSELDATVPVAPVSPGGQPQGLQEQLRGLTAELEVLRGRDRQSREQLQSSRAQLDEVAEAAQARQRCLQDMLHHSHVELDELRSKEDPSLRQQVHAMASELNNLGGRDSHHREDLGRAHAELDELREQERCRQEELARLREELEASTELQAQQQVLLLRARFEADEARAERRRQQQRLEDEVGRVRALHLCSTTSQSETATTCSSDCSKDTEEGGIQATLEALHGCEKQRQDLQNQAVRMSAELAALRSRDSQREEKLRMLRKEMEGVREASEDAMRAMQAKLVSTEAAKERMRESLLAAQPGLENALSRSSSRVGAELPQLGLGDGGPPTEEIVCMYNEMREALQDQERLRQDLEETTRTKEDLEEELLRTRAQLSEEVVDKNRATAILHGELAAMRSELAEARGSREQATTPLGAIASRSSSIVAEADNRQPLALAPGDIALPSVLNELRAKNQWYQDVQHEISRVRSESHEAVEAEKSLRHRMYEELSALKVNLREAQIQRRS